MPNPRAQQQLAQVSPNPLDRAVHSLKSISQPAQALGDMLASTLRGSTAATVGLPGDVMELVRLYGPEAVEKMLGKRVLPTTEEVKEMLPKATSYEHPYESIGEFLPLPGTGAAMKAATYGAGRGAGALTRAAGQAVSDAMIHQAGPLANGPLSALAPRMAMTNVVKPKGGNWETGAVEKALRPMKRNEKAAENLEEMRRIYPPDALATMSEETRASVDRAFPHLEQEVALNNWIDRNLTNYVKKEMGTPEDPIRRLAEEGVTHFPAEELRREADWTPERLEVARRKAGFPPEGMGKSPEAQGWEVKTDTAIEPTDVGTMRHLSHLFKKDITEPWMAKVPDETKVYMANDDLHASYLGFDHIMDVLRQDVAAGRIRPEQLSKVSMEQAVRRTHEFDQEMARKMAEAQLKQQEGFPVHKEYPEGYKWIELAAKDPQAYEESIRHLESNPREWQKSIEQFRIDREKQLADALKYEGDTMGHCVGGYCPDVLEGRSRIYSLRDKKGEPHVTVEVKPNQHLDFNTWFDKQPQELRDEINARARRGEHGGSVFEAPEYLAAREALPPSIKQIKGKQNQAPKEDYLPYVQDFVRGSEWSDIGDFKNTGLIRHEGKVMTPAEYDDMLLKELTPPEEGMKAGGCVSISDNPDRMWMEVQDQKFGIGGAVKKAAKAAKETEKSLPAVLPRAAAKTKEDIRPYAQKMAEMMSGTFVRPDPKKSINPANKSYSQWKMEQDLEHDIRPKEDVNLTPQQIADIEKQLGMLKVGISGDTSISDKILHRAGKYELQNASEQEGGPLYGLKGNPWASNYQALKNLQTGVNELSKAYGNAPVLGQYMQMGPEGTNFAQHFADANLQAIDLSNMTKSQIDDVNRIIAAGNQKSGAHPDFPGIQDPYGAYFYLSFFPELRKHLNSLMTQPTFTSKYGLPDGRVILHAITEPELRDLPVTTTGFSQFQLTPGFDPTQLPLAEHGTYTHKLPSVEGALPTRSKYPTPAQIDFPDVTEYAVKEYRPQDITRVFQTATPRQIIDQQHIDEIKMYEELMKEYTGKADGGAVKQLSQTAQEHLAKLKAIRDQLAPVADAWTAKQAEDANKYTPDIQQFKLPIGKAAGGEISADDIILEERPL